MNDHSSAFGHTATNENDTIHATSPTKQFGRSLRCSTYFRINVSFSGRETRCSAANRVSRLESHYTRVYHILRVIYPYDKGLLSMSKEFSEKRVFEPRVTSRFRLNQPPALSYRSNPAIRTLVHEKIIRFTPTDTKIASRSSIL